jgi:hypothetical protein
MIYSLPTILIFVLVIVTSPIAGRRSRYRLHHTDEDDSFNEVLDEEDYRLALQHSQRVSAASKCEVPRLQVIHVNDHFPGKYYLPQCTLLHRCGKHAGCCAVESLKCVAAEKEKVTLYFYSVKFDGDNLTERKIEKLVFTNHTRCACAPVDLK